MTEPPLQRAVRPPTALPSVMHGMSLSRDDTLGFPSSCIPGQLGHLEGQSYHRVHGIILRGLYIRRLAT